MASEALEISSPFVCWRLFLLQQAYYFSETHHKALNNRVKLKLTLHTSLKKFRTSLSYLGQPRGIHYVDKLKIWGPLT